MAARTVTRAPGGNRTTDIGVRPCRRLCPFRPHGSTGLDPRKLGSRSPRSLNWFIITPIDCLLSCPKSGQYIQALQDDVEATRPGIRAAGRTRGRGDAGTSDHRTHDTGRQGSAQSDRTWGTARPGSGRHVERSTRDWFSCGSFATISTSGCGAAVTWMSRAISSAGEHCLHTAGVTGSIPVSPTT